MTDRPPLPPASAARALGGTPLAWHGVRGLFLLIAVGTSAGGAAGCRKKTDAVEAVAAGPKPPVVKKKVSAATNAAKVGEPNAKPGEANAKPGEANAKPGQPNARPLDPAARPLDPSAKVMEPSGNPGDARPATPDAGAAPAPVPDASQPPPTLPVVAEPAPAAVAPPAVPEPIAAAAPEAARVLREPDLAVAPAEPTPPGEPPLDVTGYIWAADLEQVLGPKQKFRRADLAGIAPSPRYNALYFAPQKGDQFGIGVQVWRDENLAESRTRFNTMRNTWTNVAPTNKVTEQGFRSYFGSVVSLVFADPRRPLIAAVTCSQKTCNADALIALSQRVAERLR